MKVIKFRNKCPYCGSLTRKRLHGEGFFFEWVPLARRYACRWCYGAYTVIIGWIAVGEK